MLLSEAKRTNLAIFPVPASGVSKQYIQVGRTNAKTTLASAGLPHTMLQVRKHHQRAVKAYAYRITVEPNL